jgi:hypothetical protein
MIEWIILLVECGYTDWVCASWWFVECNPTNKHQNYAYCEENAAIAQNGE